MRDHWEIGKYGGAVHSICNSKFTLPREIL